MNLEMKKGIPWWVKMTLMLVGLMMLGSGVWLYLSEQQSHRRTAYAQLETIAQMKIEQIVLWRAERKNDAQTLMESPFLAEAIAQFVREPRPALKDRLVKRFRSLMIHYGYQDVLLVDPEGKVLLRLTKDLIPIDEWGMEALKRAFQKRQSVMTDLHRPPGEDNPHLSVIVPFFGGNRDPLGAILLHHEAKRFLFPTLQSWPLFSATGETLMVRRDGDSVLFLNDLRHQKGAALTLRIPLSQKEVPAVRVVLGHRGVLEGKDYRGKTVLSALKAVPDSDWFLVAKVDASEALSVMRNQSVLILLLFSVLILALTAFAGILWQRNEKRHLLVLLEAETSRQKSEERYRITLMGVGDGVIATDTSGRVEMLNPVAEALTGWKQEEARGRPLKEIFFIINEESRQPMEDPAAKVLKHGKVVGLANHTMLISRDGTERPIADSGAPIRDEKGNIAGVALIFRDQSEEKRDRDILGVRLSLFEYAALHTVDELMRKTLDEICALTGSPIGFFHFVDPDQKSLTLQTWSSKTLQMFCKAEGKGLHYGIDQAGVWVDCVHQRRAVIHNNYQALPHRKGLPEGHAEVVRELVVPIMRSDRIVAILGLGNKPQDYTDKDIAIVSSLADVAWEIIQRKQSEEELRIEKKRFHLLTESASYGIVMVNKEGYFEYLNPKFREIFGYDLTTVPNGRTFFEKAYPDPEYRRQVISAWKEDWGIPLPGEKIPRIFTARDSTGKDRIIHFHSVQLEGGDLMTTCQDITERIEAEKEIHRLNADLEQRVQERTAELETTNKELMSISHSIAHDFKAPLRHIIGFTTLLEKRLANALDDQSRHYMRVITNSTVKMGLLIDDILSYMKTNLSELGKMKINMELVLGEMLKLFLPDLTGRKVDWNLRPLPEGYGDPAMIQMVWINLISNAVKFTGRKPEAVIEIGYQADQGSGGAYYVKDNGAGFDMSYQDKLFGLFQRLHHETDFEGTGLGLANVRRIIERHGGRIWAEGKVGEGATFYFALPKG